jgi:hypothetical protein
MMSVTFALISHVSSFFSLILVQGALETFIDNVTVQVGERHLIDDLEQVFSPPDVMQSWTDEQIAALAKEPRALVEKRDALERKRRLLEEALMDLAKLPPEV